MNTEKRQVPVLIVRRVIQATRDKVFCAWTDPEIMKKWFHPVGARAVVTNNLEVNGAFRNEMNFSPNGQSCTTETVSAEETSFVDFGSYLETIEPEKIVFPWNSPIVTESRVTVELKDLARVLNSGLIFAAISKNVTAKVGSDQSGGLVCVAYTGNTTSCGGMTIPKSGCSCCSRSLRFSEENKGLWVCDNNIGMHCPVNSYEVEHDPCPYPGQTGSCYTCMRDWGIDGADQIPE